MHLPPPILSTELCFLFISSAQLAAGLVPGQKGCASDTLDCLKLTAGNSGGRAMDATACPEALQLNYLRCVKYCIFNPTQCPVALGDDFADRGPRSTIARCMRGDIPGVL